MLKFLINIANDPGNGLDDRRTLYNLIYIAYTQIKVILARGWGTSRVLSKMYQECVDVGQKCNC